MKSIVSENVDLFDLRLKFIIIYEVIFGDTDGFWLEVFETQRKSNSSIFWEHLFLLALLCFFYFSNFTFLSWGAVSMKRILYATRMSIISI